MLIVNVSTPMADTTEGTADKSVMVVAKPTLTVKLSAVPEYVAAAVAAAVVAVAAAPAA